MNDRLRKALDHIDELPSHDQEELADIIDEMWQTAQLPDFDPAKVPQDAGDFEAELEELDRIRGKPQRAPRS